MNSLSLSDIYLIMTQHPDGSGIKYIKLANYKKSGRNDRLTDIIFILLAVELTILVFDATLVAAVGARIWLELDVAELQHGRHQLQHRLHLVLHEAHNLHGILGGQEANTTQIKSHS